MSQAVARARAAHGARVSQPPTPVGATGTPVPASVAVGQLLVALEHVLLRRAAPQLATSARLLRARERERTEDDGEGGDEGDAPTSSTLVARAAAMRSAASLHALGAAALEAARIAAGLSLADDPSHDQLYVGPAVWVDAAGAQPARTVTSEAATRATPPMPPAAAQQAAAAAGAARAAQQAAAAAHQAQAAANAAQRAVEALESAREAVAAAAASATTSARAAPAVTTRSHPLTLVEGDFFWTD